MYTLLEANDFQIAKSKLGEHPVVEIKSKAQVAPRVLIVDFGPRTFSLGTGTEFA